MLIPAVLAALVGLCFLVLHAQARVPGSMAAGLGWLGYAGYEALMHARVLCSGECNIRVDLLLIWPLLGLLALAVPVRWWLQRRRQRS